MPRGLRLAARRLLIATCWTYFTYLFAWFGVYASTGQRFWPMALLDGVSLALFAPVPIAVTLGAAFRRREILAGGGIALLMAAWLWGWLFLPRPPTVRASTDTLTVMTYNLFGPAQDPVGAVDVIRAEDPDVVMFQELNPEHAVAFEQELGSAYPYRVLRGVHGVTGMGTISKYPITDTGQRLTGHYVGAPQVLTLDWGRRSITLLNYHLPPPPLSPREHGVREADAEVIAETARSAAERGPVIAAGDHNVTHLSDPYRIITGVLTDSWGEAGHGFGNTWGGTLFTSKIGLGFPSWLVRIDYVFHSPDLHAVEARNAQFDESSDHRGVVVTLAPSALERPRPAS